MKKLLTCCLGLLLLSCNNKTPDAPKMMDTPLIQEQETTDTALSIVIHDYTTQENDTLEVTGTTTVDLLLESPDTGAHLQLVEEGGCLRLVSFKYYGDTRMTTDVVIARGYRDYGVYSSLSAGEREDPTEIFSSGENDFRLEITGESGERIIINCRLDWQL